MSSRRPVVVTLLLAGALILIPSARNVTSAPTSYTLTCRGGGSMVGVYGPLRSGGSDITISFEKASRGATQRQPGPGECAWVDRALRDSEPDRLYFRSEDQWVSRVDISASSPYKVFVHGHDLKYLVEGITSDRLFYVRCYAAQYPSRLIVTKVGP